MRAILLFALVLIAGSISAQDNSSKIYKELTKVVAVEHFTEDGLLRETGTYVDGQLHGQWVAYAEDGTPTVIANYSNGVKNGQWFYWNEDQNEIRVVVYNNNEISKIMEMEGKRSDMLALR